MMRKTITMALLTLSLALVAGCSSEEDCTGAACRSSDPEPQSNHPPVAACTDQCDVFAGCDVMDVETCVDACRHDVFTRSEMACLIQAACENEAFGECFDDDSHRF